MSNKSDNLEIVHEGWLTKSPPTKRIWRAVSSFVFCRLGHYFSYRNLFIMLYWWIFCVITIVY